MTPGLSAMGKANVKSPGGQSKGGAREAGERAVSFPQENLGKPRCPLEGCLHPRCSSENRRCGPPALKHSCGRCPDAQPRSAPKGVPRLQVGRVPRCPVSAERRPRPPRHCAALPAEVLVNFDCFIFIFLILGWNLGLSSLSYVPSPFCCFGAESR